MSAVTMPRWLPLEVEGVDFGYVERPLFKNFRAGFYQRGFYLLRPQHHVNGGTYLLRFLAGLTLPKRGVVRAGECCLSEMAFEEFLPWTQELGFAFDSGGLLANRSVRDNLLLPLAYHRPRQLKEHQQTVDQLIRRYDLTELGDERPADLPLRDYKLTLLLRAIVHRPRVLFMVDPEESVSPRLLESFVEEVSERFAELP